MPALVVREMVDRVYLTLDNRHWQVRFVNGLPRTIILLLAGGETRVYWHSAHRKIGGPGTITSRVLDAARQVLNDNP